MHSGIEGFTPEQIFFGHPEGDLQAVRFDRLDAQALREGDTADIDVDVPSACRGVELGRKVKSVEAEFAFRLCRAEVELAEGGVELQDDRVACGEHTVAIVQHKAEVQGIARTPYAAVAVDKAFDTFLHDFAGDIERA